MELKELRLEIDRIDEELVCLFCARMDVAAKIGDYKRQRNLPVFVPQREQEKLADVMEKAGPEMAGYTKTLYETLFSLSRSYQQERTDHTEVV